MKLATVILGVLILSLHLGPMSCAAQQIEVLTVSDRNLSLDMGPGFELLRLDHNASTDGLFMYNLALTDLNDTQRRFAYLSVITVYDEVMRGMDPSTVAGILSGSIVAAAVADGAREMGNWTAVDGNGKTVTVHRLASDDPAFQASQGNVSTAAWEVDENVYVALLSLYDDQTTGQIVQTMGVGQATG